MSQDPENSDIDFVRVYLNMQYIVPAIEEAIESAKLALLEAQSSMMSCISPLMWKPRQMPHRMMLNDLELDS